MSVNCEDGKSLHICGVHNIRQLVMFWAASENHSQPIRSSVRTVSHWFMFSTFLCDCVLSPKFAAWAPSPPSSPFNALPSSLTGSARRAVLTAWIPLSVRHLKCVSMEARKDFCFSQVQQIRYIRNICCIPCELHVMKTAWCNLHLWFRVEGC